MAALSSIFGRFRAAKPDRETIQKIKQWAMLHPKCTPETSLAVNEIDCNDPACPGVETIILIMAKGKKTQACKIPKAMIDVQAEDVASALAEVEI
ncbi:hypothetical protein WJT86_08685 [Microvirga sp. W0021]|uniref:Nitrate reductase n=1 Tax=Hohaiivirga grylli TaxID=3133970 RepID=A0ABV0BMT6_9HYPH